MAASTRSTLAVLAAACVLAGCGQPASGHRATAASGAAAGRPAALGTEALDSFVPATAAQYATGARFDGALAALRSGAVDTCMARHGFHVRAGFGLSAAAFAAIDVNNSQFPDLARIARTRSFGVGNGFARQPGPPAARRQAYAADIAACSRAASEPFIGLLRAGSSLQDQWLTIIATVQNSPPVRARLAGFATCLEQAGVPHSSAGSLGAFLAWETGVDTHAGSAAGIRAADAHWAPVFARCAGPTVSLQERLQSAKRAVFLRHNAGRVRQLETLATRVLAAAQRQARTA